MRSPAKSSVSSLRKKERVRKAPCNHISTPIAASSISPGKYTLCVIPSDPVKKDRDTELLVEELLTFFEKQPDYIVVERERLDLMIRELELKTLNLTEDKLRFSLGEIFDARGIIFVKAFEHPGRLWAKRF